MARIVIPIPARAKARLAKVAEIREGAAHAMASSAIHDSRSNQILNLGLALLMFLCGVLTATAGDFWVDDASGSGGNGTESAPFHWGNSADRFDEGMRSAAAGTSIH